MFAVLHSDINSLKSGLLHFTGQPYCKNYRLAKVKDGITTSFLRNILLIDTYTIYEALLVPLSLFSVAYTINTVTLIES